MRVIDMHAALLLVQQLHVDQRRRIQRYAALRQMHKALVQPVCMHATAHISIPIFL